MNNSGYTYNDYLKQNDHVASDHRTDIPNSGLDMVPHRRSQTFQRISVIIVICVLLVPVLLQIFYYLPAITPDSAVRKYEKFLHGQEHLAESMAPAEYWDYLRKQNNRTKTAEIDSAQKNAFAVGWAVEKGYALYDLSLEATSEQPASPEDSQKVHSFLNTCGISSIWIGDCKRLVLRATYEGEYATLTAVKEVYAVQIGIFWYLLVPSAGAPGGYSFLCNYRFFQNYETDIH
jgi:hypothetical protein